MIPAAKAPEDSGHSAPVLCISALRSGSFASCAMEGDCTIKIWRDETLTQPSTSKTEVQEALPQPQQQQQPPLNAANPNGN